jgi:hypothetical protein
MSPISRFKATNMSERKGEERQGNFIDTCSRCRTNWSCCLGTRPPISRKRKEIIEAFLKKRRILTKDAFATEEGYVFPKEQANGYCIFHDTKARKCIIHPVKPETCVAGPITFDINIWNGRIEWFLKMNKICELAGEVGKNKQVLQKHLTSAKKEVFALVKELDEEGLRAILEKDEPETFRIGEDDVGKDILDKLR